MSLSLLLLPLGHKLVKTNIKNRRILTQMRINDVVNESYYIFGLEKSTCFFVRTNLMTIVFD